jgi:tetrapyrrole methylase family protein/MazG family protein
MSQPPHHNHVPPQTGFDRLVQIMAALRAPDGCPWDRKQTHDSLKPYLLEETYEVLETIDQHDMAKLREELGDLLLQILFHAQIAAEQGRFTIEDVMGLLADKLIRRHPHVFNKPASGQDRLSPEEVYGKWEQIKRQEREAAGRTQSVLDGVPNTLPALLRAYQVQARAARVGFDWPDSREGTAQVLEKVEEECRELQAALSGDPGGADGVRSRSQEQITAEFGDVLFSLVNLARKLTVNPEDALRLATGRFVDRFHYIEAEARRTGRSLDSMSLEEMDRLWADAKKAGSSAERASIVALHTTPRPSGAPS